MPESAESPDLGRYEAQRRSLGSLLARFTADRDALIGSIQAFEERLAVLGDRVNAMNAGAGLQVTGSVGGPLELDEFRNGLEQLREEQKQAWARAKAEAEHARERADEALRAIEALNVPGSADAAGREAAKSGLAQAVAKIEQLEASVGDLQSLMSSMTATFSGKDELDEVSRQMRGLESKLAQSIAALQSQLAEVETAAGQPATSGGDSDAEGLSVARLGDLRRELAVLRGVALSAAGIRQVWMTIVLSALVAAIGVAALSQ